MSACACGWGTGWIRQWYKANSQACTGTRSLLMKDEKSVLLEGRILGKREHVGVKAGGHIFPLRNGPWSCGRQKGAPTATRRQGLAKTRLFLAAFLDIACFTVLCVFAWLLFGCLAL